MSRTAIGLSFALVLMLSAAGACSSKSVGKNDSSSGYCSTYCAKLTACDDSKDQQVCEGTCERDADSDKLRGDFISYVKGCLEDQACGALTGGEALAGCADGAIASVMPSSSGSTFCDNLATKLGECDMTSAISAVECSGAVKTYDDAAVAEAGACLEKPCVSLIDCVNLALPPRDGSSTPPAGTGGSGGSGGTGGGAGGVSGGSGGSPSGCSGTPTKCLDDATAEYCNTQTMQLETAVCADEFLKEGLVSNGCLSDADGDGCTVDDFTDMACFDGTEPFGVCGNFAPADYIDIYVACFLDENGLKAVVPCFTDFVDETVTPPVVDCAGAEAACFPAP